VSDEDAMKVGSWGFEGEATKDRVIEASEFEPGKIGGAIESGFENRKECTDEDGTEQTEGGGGEGFG
jgi:hypothetical protein